MASVASMQKGASVTVIPAAVPELEVGDLKVLAVDALLDKKLGSHVVTVEANAYFMDKFQPINRLYTFGLGYVSPPIGPVRIAPAARIQIGTVPEVMSAANPTRSRDRTRSGIQADRRLHSVPGQVALRQDHGGRLLD